MKKLLPLFIVCCLSGCASEPTKQIVELEQTTHYLKAQTAELKRNIASLKISLAYTQVTPDSNQYEKARLRNQIRILDESFAEEVRTLNKKIFETEQLLEFSIIRIKSLEDARPVVKPMDPKKPSFHKPSTER